MDEICYIFDKLVESIGGKQVTTTELEEYTNLSLLNMVSYPVVDQINSKLNIFINNFQFIFTPSNTQCLNVIEVSFEYHNCVLFKTFKNDDIAKINFSCFLMFNYIFMRN